MDLKENINPLLIPHETLVVKKSSTSRSSSFHAFANDIQTEKEYLLKLKTQRQKTEKLHSEYIKLRKQKESLKQNYQNQITSLQYSVGNCEQKVKKKTEQNIQLSKQLQRYKNQNQKILRDKNDVVSKLKSSYQESYLNLKQNINSLTQSLESKNKTINHLKKNHQSKIKDLQCSINRLEEKNKESCAKIKHLQDKAKVYEQKLGDLDHCKQQQELQLNKIRLQSQIKMKQINSLKVSMQRNSFQNEQNIIKINQYEEQFSILQDKLTKVQKQNEKLTDHNQQLSKQLQTVKSAIISLQTQLSQKNQQSFKLQQEIRRKQENIKQYQTKILTLQAEQNWKQKLLEKESQNQGLLRTIQRLKDENYSLMSFIKQRQILEKQRRSLMENQMEEIDKFQNLLKDVN